ncbi:protein MGARP [Eleutherodactylus coqui]|uniref:protein MGARP n=1 Tax=Eleutherodactylus coqui TaxID=57060 RepID=UPI003461AE5C
MHLCRSAWQKLSPLTHRGAAALLRNAPVRQMSSSSVPESSGGSLPYYLFIGGSLVGGGYYVYHKLRQDKEYLGDRYEFVYGKLRPEIEDDGKIIQVVGLQIAQKMPAAFQNKSYVLHSFSTLAKKSRSLVRNIELSKEGKLFKLVNVVLNIAKSLHDKPDVYLLIMATILVETSLGIVVLETYHLCSPPLKGNEEASAVSETIEEVVEVAVETPAEEATEQEAAPIETLEQEPTAVEDETASAPTEQESAASTEIASEQG